MNRKTLILFGAAGVLLVVALILAVFLRSSREEPISPNVDNQNGNQNNTSQVTSRTIGSITATQLGDGRVLLENKKNNYQIIVTSDWMLPEEMGDDFVLYYGEPEILEKCYEGCDNVAILSIGIFDNNKQYNFDEWFKNLNAVTTPYLGERGSYKEIMINGQASFRSSQKSYEPNDYGEIVLRDDSSIINYLFFRESKVYRVKCISSGSDYENLIQICDNQVKSFSIK